MEKFKNEIIVLKPLFSWESMIYEFNHRKFVTVINQLSCEAILIITTFEIEFEKGKPSSLNILSQAKFIGYAKDIHIY